MTRRALTPAEAAEYRRLVAAGVRDEAAARLLAVEVTGRRAVRGDDERAYWRHLSHASPQARAAHAAREAARTRHRGSR